MSPSDQLAQLILNAYHFFAKVGHVVAVLVVTVLICYYGYKAIVWFFKSAWMLLEGTWDNIFRKRE